jgi:glutathione synthase
MRFVFLMDTLDRVSPDKDTTFAFIEAAQKAGHESLHALPTDLGVRKGRVFTMVRGIRTAEDEPRIHLVGERREVALDTVDAVFIRKDPPFDQAYLYATLLLENARGGPLIVNDPRGLRDANEKLYAMHFPKWTPATVVTADRDVIFTFVKEVGGNAVIKPLDGAGGTGVCMLREGDKNNRAIVDMLTAEGQRLAMVQEFLPAVQKGDKRILLLAGEPLGAIMRIARGDDIRSNIHVGGRVEPCDITETERTMIADIGPRLAADGLYFVGLDVIGERLTEVNVTSPTGIQELGRFTNTRPADKVVAWVEQKRAQRG